MAILHGDNWLVNHILRFCFHISIRANLKFNSSMPMHIRFKEGSRSLMFTADRTVIIPFYFDGLPIIIGQVTNEHFPANGSPSPVINLTASAASRQPKTPAVKPIIGMSGFLPGD